MIYRVGTDLRKDNVYTFPLSPEGEVTPESKTYPSLTSIIRLVGGGADFAAGTWTAQEAQRLFAAHNAGESVWKYAGAEWDGSRFERLYREMPAGELLTDAEHLRMFHVTELGRTADRGTVVHSLANYYSGETNYPLADEDIKHWVDDVVGYGDGTQPYRCDVDETTAYCISLNQWIREKGVRILRSEFAGISTTYGYACTCDALCLIGDETQMSLVDFKTRASTSRADVWQLAAQSKVDLIVSNWDTAGNGRELFSVVKYVRSVLVTPEGVSVKTVPQETLDMAFDEFLAIRSLHEKLAANNGLTKSGVSSAGLCKQDKDASHKTAYKEKVIA